MKEHKTVSIADQIFEQLERDILSGKYPRGEILSELRLSEELGVSRTPVREAVRRLEQEHILEEGSKGLIVVGISREDMLDMYDIRINLEGSAAARAAERISEETLHQMEEVLDLQKYYIDKGAESQSRTDKIKEQDTLFHEMIYNSCGSVPYADILKLLHRKIVKFRKASVSRQRRAEESWAEHIAIFEALKAHEPELARARAVQHIINARDNIKAMDDIS